MPFARHGLVIIAMLVPLGLFIWDHYSSGRWEAVDASAPAGRPALYTAALVLLIPIGFYFVIRERASEMVRGLVATTVLIGTAPSPI
jgi:hypothetical protein